MAGVRAYIRVSTEEQAETGFSIPAQRERIQAFCQSQGWAVLDWYVEEGRSAKDLERPELQRLLQELRADEVVLVYRLDRLTRSVLDLYSLLRSFEQTGAAFRSVSEVYDTTTAIGRLFITLVAALAQWERENLAERVKMGMVQAAAQGRRMGGAAPFGYDLADGRLAVNPAEAAVVRRLFERYLQGDGVRSLVVWASRQGIRTKNGKPWTDSAMGYILHNPAYAGFLRWGKPQGGRAPVLVPAPEIPALISPATFEAAQACLARRRAAPPRTAAGVYPLSGLLHCGVCGLPMRGRRQVRARPDSTPAVTRYYVCRSWEQRKECSVHRVRAEYLEAEMMARAAAALPPCDESLARDLAIELGAEDCGAETMQLQVEKQQLAARRRRWLDAFEQGAVTATDLKARLQDLSEREAGIDGRLTALPARGKLDPADFHGRLTNLPWVWEHATLGEKKQIVQAFARTIIYRPGTPLAIEWHDDARSQNLPDLACAGGCAPSPQRGAG